MIVKLICLPVTAAERRKKAEDAAGPAISSNQKGLAVMASAKETRVVHKDGRKFLMEVDIVSPSAREIVKQSSALDKGTVNHTTTMPAPTNFSDKVRAGQLFSNDVSPTQSRDFEQLKIEIMREQQKLLNVVEQQGAVLQDVQARLQNQHLSPVKPIQPKRQHTHLRSSELDGPAARHLKCACILSQLSCLKTQASSHCRYLMQQEEVLLGESAETGNVGRSHGVRVQDVFPEESVSSQPSPSSRWVAGLQQDSNHCSDNESYQSSM
jgi:hypothetical protein